MPIADDYDAIRKRLDGHAPPPASTPACKLCKDLGSKLGVEPRFRNGVFGIICPGCGKQ